MEILVVVGEASKLFHGITNRTDASIHSCIHLFSVCLLKHLL